MKEVDLRSVHKGGRGYGNGTRISCEGGSREVKLRGRFGETKSLIVDAYGGGIIREGQEVRGLGHSVIGGGAECDEKGVLGERDAVRSAVSVCTA